MTKAVLFDVDGTLIDTVDLHAKAWVEALKHFGVRSTFEDMRLQIGKGGDQVLLGLVPPAELERPKRSRSFGATSSRGSIFGRPVHSRPCASSFSG
jgi:beta-phosphoglucomutase-like phosphatase (HAD superfamily)